jgi:hypothetical protein
MTKFYISTVLALTLTTALPALADNEACLDAAQLAPLSKADATPAEMAMAISQTGQAALTAYQAGSATAAAKQDCVALLSKLQVMAGQPVIVAADPALYATLTLTMAKQGIQLAAEKSTQDSAQAAQLPAYQPPVLATDLLRR